MNKVFIGLLLSGATLAWTGCSDTWGDHYDNVSVGHNGLSLWENINADSRLAPFAKVLTATGYDKQLDSPQMLTVWAPIISDNTADSLITVYNKEKSEGVKDDYNSVIVQFVKNHIALYNTSVSSYTNDTIMMLNGKYMNLQPTSLENESFLDKNIQASNGVLYKVGEKLAFYPNIWERIQQTAGLDSIANFFKSFNENVLNESASVAGGVVDGMTVYLDSVTVLQNKLFSTYGYINREDSSYLFLGLTNPVWNELVDKYASYYNYSNALTPQVRDSLTNTYARLSVVCGLFFNKNLNPDRSIQDSLVNTMYSKYYPETNVFYKPFASGGILSGLEPVKCSNGDLYVASDSRIDPKLTFMSDLDVEGEYSRYYETDKDASGKDLMLVSYLAANDTANVNGKHYDFKVSNGYFLQVMATASGSQSKITYTIPSTLSNVYYNIYVVMAPAIAYNEKAAAEDTLPVKFRAKLLRCKEDGSMEAASSVRNLTVPEGELNAGTTNFITTPNKLDTICLATGVQFDYSGYGLDDGVVQVILETYVLSTENRRTYTRTFRIDEIIMSPYDTKEQAEENRKKLNHKANKR